MLSASRQASRCSRRAALQEATLVGLIFELGKEFSRTTHDGGSQNRSRNAEQGRHSGEVMLGRDPLSPRVNSLPRGPASIIEIAIRGVRRRDARSPRWRLTRSPCQRVPLLSRATLAVLRLITSSSLVGCSTGMSATLMPWKSWTSCLAVISWTS